MRMKYKNNPLNIRMSGSKWVGLTGSKNGFCEFSNLDYGVRAACYLIMRTYRRYGITSIRDIIARWAPPSENPTAGYISFVCKSTLYSMYDEIDSEEKVACLIEAMAIFEQGHYNVLDRVYVLRVIHDFKITFSTNVNKR